MRRAYDYYPTTEANAVWGLLTQTPVQFSGDVLECCSGQHHITRVLQQSSLFTRVWTNDIQSTFDADFHENVTLSSAWAQLPEVDWVITNPPFSHALPILQQALSHARLGVALYLRLSFWEPTFKSRARHAHHRGPFLRDHCPTGFMPLSRISHTDDGHMDSSTCAWFVWEKQTTRQWHHVLMLDQDYSLA